MSRRFSPAEMTRRHALARGLMTALELDALLGPPPGRSIEGGMAIVIQPNPITPDERMGLQLGALTLVTDAGAESLHGIPLEPPA